MTLLAVILAGPVILLVGFLIGYLWGREDGREVGLGEAYDAVERYYRSR